MSKGIDYSKWDHITMDDSDEEEEELVRGAPRVTRLDAPSRITTTQDGMVHVQPTNQTTISVIEQPLPIQGTPLSAGATTAITAAAKATTDPNQKPAAAAIPASWTANGGFIDAFNLHWSQDRQVVSCRFRIPPEVPSKNLTVEWSGKIYSYADRFTAVGSNNTASFRIHHEESQFIIQGDLPHPVHYTTEEDELDWEIHRDDGGDQRYILLTLPKATPMHGMSIQWKRPLLQVPLADESSRSSSDKKPSQFQQAWDEAHTMFREKIAKGEIPKRPDGLP